MINIETGIRNVLLAEDDEDDREFFSHALRDMNKQISVDYVVNGSDLMKLLKSFSPDLLFLDLDMPCKNGFQCLVEIRETPGIENLPIIVFSSTSRQGNIQTAYEMGAHLFLVKPNTYEEYETSLQDVLKLDWLEPISIREQYCLNGRYVAFG